MVEGGAGDEWIKALEPIGTDAHKPHLTIAPWLIVVFAQRWGEFDDGTRYHLFGAGGGADLAERLGVDLVGQVPMAIPLREGSDQGRPIAAVDPDHETSQVFARMAEWIEAHKPSKRTHPELKIS